MRAEVESLTARLGERDLPDPSLLVDERRLLDAIVDEIKNRPPVSFRPQVEHVMKINGLFYYYYYYYNMERTEILHWMMGSTSLYRKCLPLSRAPSIIERKHTMSNLYDACLRSPSMKGSPKSALNRKGRRTIAEESSSTSS
jgi:hypothetical protein